MQPLQEKYAVILVMDGLIPEIKKLKLKFNEGKIWNL